jgi:ribosome-binding factor A
VTRRTDRLGHLIRNTLGELLLTRLSDPRIDPARVSITRVEVPEDLLTAKVYVSVLGPEATQRRTLRALAHAAGHIQDLLAGEVRLRHTPVLQFINDTGFKKTLQTYRIIDQAMEELRRKPHDGPGGAEAPAPEAGGRPEGS